MTQSRTTVDAEAVVHGAKLLMWFKWISSEDRGHLLAGIAAPLEGGLIPPEVDSVIH